MTDVSLLPPSFSTSLAFAVIQSSDTPMLLLGSDATIIAASRSFCLAFGIAHAQAVHARLSTLGQGEWDVPQLDALLMATASGFASIKDYDMDLARPGLPVQRLLVNAHKLDYPIESRAMVILSVSDITESRRRDRQKDSLVREKAVLLEELQHRVANSLQIIASVLLQSARRVQSDEARTHINEAHHRVMSVAELQHQLATSQIEDVGLQDYFSALCRSLGASMIRDRSTMSIAVEVDDSVVKADVSLSLGLIVTELVINALKHAFPDDRGGRIAVGYASHDGGWTLSVGDDGVGMPEDSDDRKPGLGTSIVRALAMQLDAAIETTDAHPGTLVTVAHQPAVGGAAPKVPAAV